MDTTSVPRNPQALEEKFRHALQSDRTLMLGLDGVEDGHAHSMTACVEGTCAPLWFFIGKPNGVVEHLSQSRRAIAASASQDHEIFACIHSDLVIDNDRDYADKMADVDLE